ncbi:hypothetical protein GO755_24745 [Spirosoma sp. HMF4905]|uniref:Uncharacterized protein n=1 Tax=Spirosoma arboris TaxID=2682092 RepID=A0A7K1SHK1_9BACT|nr:hypothetical protein [Spirosoma arboris]MVM33272.1 hypothetical protein [Spirosoma arboris]
MFTYLSRLIRQHRLVRQIKTMHPDLKRLSGMALIRRFIDNRLADQLRQEQRFEASLRNPALFGGYIQYPTPQPELLQQALLFVEVKPKQDVEAKLNTPLKLVKAPNTRQVIVGLSPLGKAVKSANLFQRWLTELENQGDQCEEDPAMIDYLRMTVDFYKLEVHRLTQQRSR